VKPAGMGSEGILERNTPSEKACEKRAPYQVFSVVYASKVGGWVRQGKCFFQAPAVTSVFSA
jgi:hypothetical protein